MTATYIRQTQIEAAEAKAQAIVDQHAATANTQLAWRINGETGVAGYTHKPTGVLCPNSVPMSIQNDTNVYGKSLGVKLQITHRVNGQLQRAVSHYPTWEEAMIAADSFLAQR
jgi:hypothetical protein